ncbi:unnamed protein product [Mucor hiemalis]
MATETCSRARISAKVFRQKSIIPYKYNTNHIEVLSAQFYGLTPTIYGSKMMISFITKRPMIQSPPLSLITCHKLPVIFLPCFRYN